MSLNLKDGKMIALLHDKKNKILFIDEHDQSGYKKIKLDGDSYLEPVLDDRGRSITYICGASGSGKSTMTRGLIINFNMMFPDSQVYLFSKVNTDPAFDDLEKKKIITRIPIDNQLVTDPINVLEDIEQWSLVIFDDIDTITDKNILKAVNNIKMQILEIGRHRNIYCIVTSHLITTSDRAGTRTMMNEMHNLVIFPKGGGSVYQQRYCLKNYLGFNNKQIDDILNTSDSRWVWISKNYPQYVLTQKRCNII